MIDFALGALLVVLVVRGWLRGLVREALDVATMVVGAVLAFRLAVPLGAVVADAVGVSPEVGRLIAGTVSFVAVTVGAALLSSAIHRTIRRLPAMTTLNRLGGAALGGLYAIVVATVALTLVAVLPVPAALDAGVDESVIADTLTDPQGPVQRGMETLAGVTTTG